MPDTDYQANLDFLTSIGIDVYAVMLAQLRFLRDGHLDEASFEHDHWCDDCGDYANAALRLAAELQGGYLNSTEIGVADVLIELAKTDPSCEDACCNLVGNYACDGVCSELYDTVAKICKATGLPFGYDDDEDAAEPPTVRIIIENPDDGHAIWADIPDTMAEEIERIIGRGPDTQKL